MHYKAILTVCSFFLITAISSQSTTYPKGYFRWPLDLPPQIVANLGELRSNHWHMGLDIRTNQRENQRVYAAAAGYVAYIGIRPLSFGRFIIINHPNGYSTLYGHLNDFSPTLEKYVTEQQYRKESWAVELTLSPDQFPVSKGTFIAYSGNTGGSQGPHVHFEIRDTKTGECINPLFFGMPLRDEVKPTITRLALYDRTHGSYAASPRLVPVKATAAGYVVAGTGIIKTGARQVSFGLQAFDRISGSSNQDGIYSASLEVDGRSIIRFELDRIGYEQTRYMNAHIDYPYKQRGGAYLQHISQLPGERSGVYRPGSGDGVISLSDTGVHSVRIEVRDSYKNLSVLQFKIQYDATMATVRPSQAPQVFTPNYVNVLERSGFGIYLKEGSIYDTIVPVYSTSVAAGENVLSAIHRVNDMSLPIQEPVKVRIQPLRPIPVEWQSKLIIQRTAGSSKTNRKATWENIPGQGEWISAEFTDFGSYQALVDLEPPVLQAWTGVDTVNLSGARRIAFTPTDNFGVKSFRAELNGKWLRFTNDKARTWIYEFDERCPFGTHELKVTVEDIAGNITTKTWWFKRYKYTPPPPKKKKPVTKKPAAKKPTGKK